MGKGSVNPPSDRVLARPRAARARLVAVTVAAVAALAASAVWGAWSPTPARAAAFDSASVEAQLVADININRAQAGIGALAVNPMLTYIARDGAVQACGQNVRGRSQDMIDRGYFSHQIPPCGQAVWPVLSQAGVSYSSAGENIAWNNYSPASVSVSQVNATFLASPGHRANMLGNFNQVGVGAVMAPGPWSGLNGVIMYTEIFVWGPPPPPPPAPRPTPQPINVVPGTSATPPPIGVAGVNNRLYMSPWPSSYTDLGGVLIGAPTVVSLPGGSNHLFIGTGADHDVWVRSEGVPWEPFSQGAVYCIDNPAATMVGATLVVACQGGDHALWAAQVPVGSSVPPLGAWSYLGGGLGAGPSVASVGGQALFTVTDPGHGVWTRTLSTGYSHTSWFCNGHPSMLTAGTNTYFACAGMDYALWWAVRPGGGAWSPVVRGGGITFDGAGLAAGSGGSATVYVQGADRAVWQSSLSPGGNSGWSNDNGLVRFGVGSTQ